MAAALGHFLELGDYRRQAELDVVLGHVIADLIDELHGGLLKVMNIILELLLLAAWNAQALQVLGCFEHLDKAEG